MIDSLIEKHLKNFKAKKILDVGPGYGNFSRVAARTTGATKITFIDCNSSVLSWQEDECRKTSLICELIQMPLDLNNLSNLKDSYDLILCQEILEHLINAEEILNALVHLLSEKGRIVITVPTKISEKWLKLVNPNYMQNEPYGHVREFNKNDLKKLLKRGGLSPYVLLPTQPHYFIYHTWIYGLRVKVKGSTGELLSKDIRVYIGNRLLTITRQFFKLTNFSLWSNFLPRNYFVIAGRLCHEDYV